MAAVGGKGRGRDDLSCLLFPRTGEKVPQRPKRKWQQMAAGSGQQRRAEPKPKKVGRAGLSNPSHVCDKVSEVGTE